MVESNMESTSVVESSGIYGIQASLGVSCLTTNMSVEDDEQDHSESKEDEGDTCIDEDDLSISIKDTSRLGIRHSCRICKIVLNSHQSLIAHMRTHAGEKPFECSVCASTFGTVNNLNIHMRLHTGEKPYQCDLCKRSFAHSNTLKLHMRIHTGERPYQCTICGEQFLRCDQLRRHKAVHTGLKPYNCNVCGKSYTQINSLKMHMERHTDEKPHECGVCFKKFSNVVTLKRHMKNHEEKKFKCDFCDKSYVFKAELKRHMSTQHSDERPFQCSVCDKAFHLAFYLTNHMKLHTDRPFHCVDCKQSFKNEKFLLIHREKKHDETVKVACPHCAKEVRPSMLKKHMDAHDQAKKFVCEVCSKTFPLQEFLDAHMTVHSDKRRVSCSDCDKKFRWLSCLKNHSKSCRGKKSVAKKDNTKAVTSVTEHVQDQSTVASDIQAIGPGSHQPQQQPMDSHCAVPGESIYIKSEPDSLPDAVNMATDNCNSDLQSQFLPSDFQHESNFSSEQLGHVNEQHNLSKNVKDEFSQEDFSPNHHVEHGQEHLEPDVDQQPNQQPGVHEQSSETLGKTCTQLSSLLQKQGHQQQLSSILQDNRQHMTSNSLLNCERYPQEGQYYIKPDPDASHEETGHSQLYSSGSPPDDTLAQHVNYIPHPQPPQMHHQFNDSHHLQDLVHQLNQTTPLQGQMHQQLNQTTPLQGQMHQQLNQTTPLQGQMHQQLNHDDHSPYLQHVQGSVHEDPDPNCNLQPCNNLLSPQQNGQYYHQFSSTSQQHVPFSAFSKDGMQQQVSLNAQDLSGQFIKPDPDAIDGQPHISQSFPSGTEDQMTEIPEQFQNFSNNPQSPAGSTAQQADLTNNDSQANLSTVALNTVSIECSNMTRNSEASVKSNGKNCDDLNPSQLAFFVTEWNHKAVNKQILPPVGTDIVNNVPTVRTYTCPYCDHVCTNKLAMKAHVKNHENETSKLHSSSNSLSSETLNVSVPNHDADQNHKPIGRIFPCELCGKTFVYAKSFEKHMKTHGHR